MTLFERQVLCHEHPQLLLSVIRLIIGCSYGTLLFPMAWHLKL